MNLLESSFPAKLDYLREMIQLIKEQAFHYISDNTKLFHLELACEEALMNVISHAYKNGDGELTLICRTGEDSLEVIIRDSGVPFNPLTVTKETPLKNKTAEGGLGIVLLLHSADDVNYRRLNEQNILTLTFYIEKLESSS